MSKVGRVLVLLFVLFALVACDQGTKSVAQNYLSTTEPILLLDGMVRLQLMENPGAFLSLGANLPPAAQYWIFTILVGAILVGVTVYLVRETHRISTTTLVAIALLLGGGIGNLIDRLVNEGRVIDFMNVGIGGLRTGVFNVADMAIMAGVGLIMLSALRSERTAT